MKVFSVIILISLVAVGLVFAQTHEYRYSADNGCVHKYNGSEGYNTLSPSEVKKSQFQQCLMMPGADFSGVNTLGSGAPDLSGSILTGANFSSAKIPGARMFNAQLEQVDFSNADLYRTHIRDANVSRAKFHNANLKKAQLSDSYIQRTDFSNANLNSSSLNEAKGYKTVFDGASMNDANLGTINCRECDFSHTLLKNSYLTIGNFMDSNFSYANLTGANLMGANLLNANFSNANLSKVVLNEYTQFKGAYFNSYTILPFTVDVAFNKGMVFITDDGHYVSTYSDYLNLTSNQGSRLRKFLPKTNPQISPQQESLPGRKARK